MGSGKDSRGRWCRSVPESFASLWIGMDQQLVSRRLKSQKSMVQMGVVVSAALPLGLDRALTTAISSGRMEGAPFIQALRDVHGVGIHHDALKVAQFSLLCCMHG
mmetsp:Transcript_70747/g.132384  ORF Transcript_70747/g.132384 Transcript_70747/m.132384 type:complete len:105 (+) Transcript_70747:167-481(+)